MKRLQLPGVAITKFTKKETRDRSFPLPIPEDWFKPALAANHVTPPVTRIVVTNRVVTNLVPSERIEGVGGYTVNGVFQGPLLDNVDSIILFGGSAKVTGVPFLIAQRAADVIKAVNDLSTLIVSGDVGFFQTGLDGPVSFAVKINLTFGEKRNPGRVQLVSSEFDSGSGRVTLLDEVVRGVKVSVFRYDVKTDKPVVIEFPPGGFHYAVFAQGKKMKVTFTSGIGADRPSNVVSATDGCMGLVNQDPKFEGTILSEADHVLVKVEAKGKEGSVFVMSFL
ncbi:hypothetical protein HYT84_03810 [Candidatus Micrarchaeota archaeon]|nr:hypothetical protein [Candidatus Micrarchaeota archaeon]